MGVLNGRGTLEDSAAVSEQVRQKCILRPSNSIPRYLPKENENTCSHKDLYTNVHRGVIHNQPWKQAKCLSIDEWIDRILCIYTKKHDLAIKRNKVLIRATTRMSLRNTTYVEDHRNKGPRSI